MKEQASVTRIKRHEVYIVALLEHPILQKAAAAVGISDVTLWRCMKQPEFAEAYRKARKEAFSQSVGRLQHASNAAVGTLLRVMTDREAGIYASRIPNNWWLFLKAVIVGSWLARQTWAAQDILTLRLFSSGCFQGRPVDRLQRLQHSCFFPG